MQAEKAFYLKKGLPVPVCTLKLRHPIHLRYVIFLQEEDKIAPITGAVDDNNHPPSKRLKKGEAHKRIYNDEVAFELALDEKYFTYPRVLFLTLWLALKMLWICPSLTNRSFVHQQKLPSTISRSS